MNSSPAFEQLRTRLEGMTLRVREAEQKILDGRVVNLQSLELEVARVCETIKGLSPTSARDIQPHMAELIGALDALAEHLSDFKAKYK